MINQLIPIAAELAGCVRDYGPDDVAAVLARVPAERRDDLIVVLASMVDPNRKPSELLAWTKRPAQSRAFTPRHLTVKAIDGETHGRNPGRREQVEAMTARGLSTDVIAHHLGISPRAVQRHRTALKAAKEKVA